MTATEIRFGGSYTRDQLVRAYRLAARPGRWVLVLLLVLLAVLVYATLVVPVRHGGSLLHALPALVVVALFLAFAWLLPRLGAGRTWRTSEAIRQPVSGVITPELVLLRSAYGEARLPWDAFYRVRASDRVVLLYQSAQVSHVLPRELFASEEDWETFKRWALGSVPSDPKGGPPRSSVLQLVVLWLAIFAVTFLLWLLFHS